nr:hypothetical protein [uncultured bacterium]
MTTGIVQRIFNDHFEQYRKGRVLEPEQWRAAWDIMTCRTPEKGYHVDACPNGDYRVILPNSCKNRSCPQCGSTETQLWLERCRRQALDCPYFHGVITISHDLHPLWMANRRLFTGLMMKGAWHSLKEMLADWKWLGGLPGVIVVFQSWDDHLGRHCHLHLIITAGGLNEDGRWVTANEEFLVYVPALAKKFKGKFLAYLKEAFNPLTKTGLSKPADQVLSPPPGKSVRQCLNLINKVGRVRWHADIEPAYDHPNGVFKYVGRYIRRGPISEKRIVNYDGKSVSIAYAHPEKHEKETFELDAQTFIHRLLYHVPEKGTHLVRSYGLFHSTSREKLNVARARLGQQAYVPTVEISSTIEVLQRMFPDLTETRCPHCGEVLRTVFVYRGGHAAPWRMAA